MVSNPYSYPLSDDARNHIRHLQSAEYLESLDGIADGVQILSQRDEDVCDRCFGRDGTFYFLDEALKYEPLPHEDCKGEICRCTYSPADRKKLLEDRQILKRENKGVEES